MTERPLKPEDAPYYVHCATTLANLWLVFICASWNAGPDIPATERLPEAEARAKLRKMQLAWYNRMIQQVSMEKDPFTPRIFCTSCGWLEKDGHCINPNCPAKDKPKATSAQSCCGKR